MNYNIGYNIGDYTKDQRRVGQEERISLPDRVSLLRTIEQDAINTARDAILNQQKFGPNYPFPPATIGDYVLWFTNETHPEDLPSRRLQRQLVNSGWHLSYLV